MRGYSDESEEESLADEESEGLGIFDTFTEGEESDRIDESHQEGSLTEAEEFSEGGMAETKEEEEKPKDDTASISVEKIEPPPPIGKSFPPESEKKEVDAYVAGNVQIPAGKIHIYMRGRVELEEGETAITKAIQKIEGTYITKETRKRLESLKAVENEKTDRLRELYVRKKQIEEALQKIDEQSKKIDEEGQEETLSGLKAEKERLQMELNEIEQQIAEVNRDKKQIQKHIREHTPKKRPPKELSNEDEERLKALQGKLHNYQRSQDMNHTLEAAGLSDDEENNNRIIAALFEAAGKVLETETESKGEEVESEITGSSGTVIIKSAWRVYRDRVGEIKKYLTTIILIPKKEGD